MVARGVASADSYGGYRTRLVEQLQARGIKDLAVLRAIATVPRHLFVPEDVRHRAYEDSALPIGHGQTISQPWVQARTLEVLRLKGTERVLEVGAGSGYQTALLGCLASAVFAVERLAPLAYAARQAVAAAGVTNVSFLVGDGTLGWRAWAPFDAIAVAARGPVLPAPLLEQLAPGGRMAIPLGPPERQVLTLVERRGDTIERTEVSDVRFVPLIGRHGA
jgi:protein-L-isoaspartate(D-aspartate) O-methyltransferase